MCVLFGQWTHRSSLTRKGVRTCTRSRQHDIVYELYNCYVYNFFFIFFARSLSPNICMHTTESVSHFMWVCGCSKSVNIIFGTGDAWKQHTDASVLMWDTIKNNLAKRIGSFAFVVNTEYGFMCAEIPKYTVDLMDHFHEMPTLTTFVHSPMWNKTREEKHKAMRMHVCGSYKVESVRQQSWVFFPLRALFYCSMPIPIQWNKMTEWTIQLNVIMYLYVSVCICADFIHNCLETTEYGRRRWRQPQTTASKAYQKRRKQQEDDDDNDEESATVREVKKDNEFE